MNGGADDAARGVVDREPRDQQVVAGRYLELGEVAQIGTREDDAVAQQRAAHA